MIPSHISVWLKEQNILGLRPAQEKAIEAGLFSDTNLLICTPTASGKTLIAEMAILNLHNKKALYLVPLKALGSEKFSDFKKRHNFSVALSLGDFDKNDVTLSQADVIIATAEKLDALIRHGASWIKDIGLIIVDEIHLLNDSHRGPTLEILLTLLRQRTSARIIGLSATVGNAQELSEWLDAQLVIDDWRPVRLEKGVYVDGTIFFPKSS